MSSDTQRELLAARLRRARGDAQGGIARRPPGMTELPLSFSQEQLWFIDRFAPGLPTYNIPVGLWLRGPLDVGALGRAVDALVVRHETLRTRLMSGADGRPFQVVDEPASVDLDVVELSQEALRALVAEEVIRPFSLAEGSLFRARLVRLAAGQHVLVVVVHHVVFDGWSIGVLVRDLAALYAAEVTGEPSGLEELPVQFADYALWERERLHSEPPGVQYWRDRLDGFQTLQMPTDRPRPRLDTFDGGVELLKLGAETLQSLRELGRGEGVTLFVVLMAGVQALLGRYTGQDDIVVGTVSANRGRAKLAPLIGFLVNTLVVRTDLSGDPTFVEMLGRVRAATVGALAHQDLPFAKLVGELRVERDPGRAPVFQVALGYVDEVEAVGAAGVAMRAKRFALPAAKFDLDFSAEVCDGELWVELSYATALFDAETMRRMLGHLRVLLAGAVQDPARRLSQLPVLTDAELRRELVEWNDTTADFPVMCIHEGFERQVARSPDEIAAEMDGQVITYAQLNADASRIARRLQGAGVGPEVLVGVSMGPSIRRLAVLLGIMKAGGGYVPLDPALPGERLSYMVRDADMPVIVADTASEPGLPVTSAQVVPVDREWAAIAALDADDPRFPVEPSNVAYVIYTSGSTGWPKGVVVEHRQAVNHAIGLIKHWPIGPGDRVLQFSSLNFDASVMDMFMTLQSGGRVVLASTQTLHSPPLLAALMRDRKVTFVFMPPAVVSLLSGQKFPDLRILTVGGEALPPDLVGAWVRPGLRFVNVYGPTENTVLATAAELDGTVLPPPIGRPLANQQAYVLDAHLNPVPIGVAGELHVGGANVTRGYLNAPQLTGQRFIPDPFRPGRRLYKTGDLVKRLPDGNIVFLGRADDQVKIHGLRVELGEIETALVSHPAVSQAVAVIAEDRSGQRQLASYVRFDGPAVDLLQYLARRLPDYMVPAYVIAVKEFPLNASGKIDKAALPALDPVDAKTAYVAPRTLIETMLTDMYARLLGREQAGIDDGFFDLGGNSLQAMQLITQIDEELAADIDVNVTAVFLAPSPRQLAELLRQMGLEDAELTDEEIEEMGS
jgi:amino acid adenylation domain-containing protein